MSSTRAWTVREANEGDSEGLADLFRSVFHFERSEEHNHWKFYENPDGPPVIAVAEDAGRIVGQYALWPTQMRLGSVVVLGAQSLDTMTHPDYRGQGMFTVLAEYCMELAAARGIDVLYGFPNENSHPGFVRKLDWHCTGRIPVWIRPLHPSKHHRIPAWLAPVADVAVKILPTGKIKPFRVEDSPRPPAALEHLIAQWRASKGRCRVERSMNRYLWRFSASSGMQYRWVSAYKGDQLVSAAVWGVDIRSGNAVLAEVIGESIIAIEAVVAEVVQQALLGNCPLLMAVSNLDEAKSALKRTGFFHQGDLPLIVRKLTARSLGANVHTHELWDIFGADLDTF